MTAKEWFYRGRRARDHVESLKQTREKLWDSVTSITTSPHGDVVSGTKDPHKFDGLAAIDDMIIKEVNRLTVIQAEIMAVILQVENLLYREVLKGRYVDNESWGELANRIGYDYYYTKGALHGKALQAAKKYIDLEK